MLHPVPFDSEPMVKRGVVSLSATDQSLIERHRGTVRFVGGVGALVGAYVAGFVALEVILKGLIS